MRKPQFTTIALLLALAGSGLAGYHWQNSDKGGDFSGLVEPSAWMGQAKAEEGAVPIANAGLDRPATVGEALVLDGTRSRDPQTGKLLTFAWSLVSAPVGSTASLDDPSLVKPRLVPDLPGDYLVELVVSREGQASAPDHVRFSTGGVAPVAHAGRDLEVELGQTVQLDATASFDFDGDELSYAWALVSLPAGSGTLLDDATAARPSLFIDAEGLYRIDLTVTDASGATSSDHLILTTDELVAKPSTERSLNDLYPVAGSPGGNPGDEVIFRPGAFGQKANDANHSNLTWALVSRPDGSAAELNDFKPVRPRLNIDQPGTYLVQLEVNGEPGNKRSGTLAIDSENLPAKPDAGSDRLVLVGQNVTLDAVGSTDLEGDLLTYRWDLITRPAGSAVVLDDADSLRASFTPDLPGLYVAQLRADDGSGEEATPSNVTLAATDGQSQPANLAPRAAAGPDQVVARKARAQLNGSGSTDPESDPLSYHWTVLEAPNGNGARLSDPEAVNPTFLVHKEGDYLVQLIVSDGLAESAPDTILITTGNRRPVANPGSGLAMGGPQTVQLDGSGSSDANGDPLTFHWALIHRPAASNAGLSDSASVTPSIALDEIGDYVVQLIVHDGTEPSLPQTVVFSVTNERPIALASADPLDALVFSPVTLEGSGSFDPNDDP